MQKQIRPGDMPGPIMTGVAKEFRIKTGMLDDRINNFIC